MAICGLVADRVVPDSYVTMSEYLFYLLTHESFKSPTATLADAIAAEAEGAVAHQPVSQSWWKVYEFDQTPASYDVLMDYIGQRYGARTRLEQGKIFIFHFREGKLGRFTLDFIG